MSECLSKMIKPPIAFNQYEFLVMIHNEFIWEFVSERYQFSAHLNDYRNNQRQH